MLKSILLVIFAIPAFHEDRGVDGKRAQLEAIARAVAAVSKTADQAAFLLAWGKAETNFSLRIHRGDCRPWECDGGKARGPWQLHRVGMPDELWAKMIGVENVQTQAEQALREVQWAFNICPRDHVRGAFRVLAGHGCTQPLKDETLRVAEFKWVRSILLSSPRDDERGREIAARVSQN